MSIIGGVPGRLRMNERHMSGAVSTRRKFIKNARYVVPAIWVLGAAPEQAFASAPASGTCLVSGAVCGNNSDCCTGLCFNPGMGDPRFCQEP